MVKNLLVEKNLWDYVSRDEVPLVVVAPATPNRGEGRGVQTLATTPPTTQQKCWDVKDDQAMSVIALTIK